MTHNNNAYYLRAITAEKELALAMESGRGLLQQLDHAHAAQYHALGTLIQMGTTLTTRRHLWVSRAAGWFGIKENPSIEQIRAMLTAIKPALAAMPAPSMPSGPGAEEGGEPSASPASPSEPEPAGKILVFPHD